MVGQDRVFLNLDGDDVLNLRMGFRIGKNRFEMGDTKMTAYFEGVSEGFVLGEKNRN